MSENLTPIGGWKCRYCGVYAPEGRQGSHPSNCPAPSGRCGKCGAPIDMHKQVDPLAGCPTGVHA